jgi:hypothetical protein
MGGGDKANMKAWRPNGDVSNITCQNLLKFMPKEITPCIFKKTYYAIMIYN